ncbi:MAG: SAM-dependent methyltransferase, partial [Erythrobacter sp. RIFCSPHIGHO2_12_FULL_63_10]
NREAIAGVLAGELPNLGTVLEIASGTGEHAMHFAALFPRLDWQPSDPDEGARASIAAWRAEYPGENLLPPISLDASKPHWPIECAEALVCINMVHISPWESTLGLFTGAERVLAADAPLILYGPYLERGVETAPSNLTFNDWLKARDPRWGLRQAEELDAVASGHGFMRSARHAMPANNIMLIYRKVQKSAG